MIHDIENNGEDDDRHVRRDLPPPRLGAVGAERVP